MTNEPETTASDVPEPAERPKKHVLPAGIRAMRPRQWVKNVLVVAAPLTAGELLNANVLLDTLFAFISFCMISATVYLMNDIKDVEEDRLHPRKRFRPIAAGELKVPAAWVLAALTAIIGFGLGFFTSTNLGITLAVYLILQVLYSMFLKHQPIIDLAMVSSGFLLRAIAGGVASGIVLSNWFLLVAAFGSLFMVAGKRYSELKLLGSEAGTRRSLEAYSVSYLRFAWHLSAAVTLVCYCLWAFERQTAGITDVPWSVLSIAPITIGLLQYAMEIDQGGAGEPEDVVINNRPLQISGLLTVILIGMAVFTGGQ